MEHQGGHGLAVRPGAGVKCVKLARGGRRRLGNVDVLAPRNRWALADFPVLNCTVPPNCLLFC